MKQLAITVFAAVGIVGISVCLAQIRKELFSCEQLFPKSQQRRMGLHKLSDTEKEALRSHVEALLVKVIAASKSSGTSTKRSSGGRVYAGVGGGHWIKKNVDSGT